jgi:hypothetical protein
VRAGCKKGVKTGAVLRPIEVDDVADWLRPDDLPEKVAPDDHVTRDSLARVEYHRYRSGGMAGYGKDRPGHTKWREAQRTCDGDDFNVIRERWVGLSKA